MVVTIGTENGRSVRRTEERPGHEDSPRCGRAAKSVQRHPRFIRKVAAISWFKDYRRRVKRGAAVDRTADKNSAIRETIGRRSFGIQVDASGQVDPRHRIGRAQVCAAGSFREIGNQRPCPGKAPVIGHGIAAIHRAAVGKAPFLENGGQELRRYLRTRDVRFRLRSHCRWERWRIIAEPQIRRDPQIERDPRRSVTARRRGGQSRRNQVSSMVEQHQGAG